MVECEYRYLTEKLSNQSGFNRYMVECELHSAFCACFNRYMVECEFLIFPSVLTVRISFNRYMVECEFSSDGTATV